MPAAAPLAFEIGGTDCLIMRGQILQHLGEMDRWQEHVFEAIGRYGRQVVGSRQFQQEGAYLGDRWADLSPSYVEWKAAQFGNTQIGVRTGAMQHGLTSPDESVFTMSWTGKRGTSYQVEGKPVLVYDDSQVTFGTEATQNGEEYSRRFNGQRSIFGDQKLPSETEWEMGNLARIPYVAAMHTSQGGDLTYDNPPSEEILRYIRSRRMGDLSL